VIAALKSPRVALSDRQDGGDFSAQLPMNQTPIPVLIVDDDPTIAAMLKQVIKNLGGGFVCETAWANCGAAAREALGKRVFRLVLLDYLLPDEDGLAVLLAINEWPVAQRPAVIMLTGGGNEQVAVEAMKLGAKDYLVKTAMNLPALRRSIVAALEHQRLQGELNRSREELERKKAEMDADLALARGVQQALLPQTYPVFPAGARPADSLLQFAHRWIPSEKVAGDLFDVFAVTDKMAGVFICDVMGHGVRAALVTALLRGLLREQRPLASRPGDMLAELNNGLQTLLGRTRDLVFVTATYAVIDTQTGQVRLASAGHPAPIHLRRRGGVALSLESGEGPGAALGLLPDALYEVTHYTLERGDGLLMFTDGVFEATRADGEEFGRARLRSAVEARLNLPAPLLIDALLAEVEAYQGPDRRGFEDDICMVSVDFAAPGRE
jgi:phosphoserine phosphatase RsbU/P